MEIDSDVNSNHSDPDTQVLSDLNVNNCSSTHFREIRSFSFKKENGTCNGDYMKYDKLFLEEDEAKMECDALTCNQVMHSNKMLDANKDDDFLNSYNEEGDTDIGSEDEGAFCEQTNGHQNLFAEKGSRYGSLTFETRQSADASEEMSSTIEAEDGEILEDGEIADDDDLYRDESEGSPEIQEQRENTSVEMNEDDEETILKTDQKEKRKLKRNKRRKDKNKKKYKRLEYIDHDRIDDEISKQGWTGSGKKSSPGPNESPTSKHSPQGPFDSPYHRSPPGPYDSPYESPPGIYDSPSEDEDSPDCFPNKPKKSLLSMVDDGFMDPNVAANEKEDMFQARRRGCGRNAPGLRRNKKQYDGHSHHHHHHHHMPKKKPLLETPPHMRTPCKFFKEGKCAKGCDCPFGHDFKPPRKPDICKFYLNSVCTKGDNCLYMHGEYPCKFFHTGSTCYQGDTCKFSHEPLTEETKILLEKILDNRDDEKSEHEMCQPSKPRPSLLGSPPRHLKESVRQNSDRNRDKHPPPPPPPPWEMIHPQCKKIPSLLDIKVYPPGQSPKKQSSLQGQPASRPGFYKEVMNSPTNSNSSASKPGGLNQVMGSTLVQQQGQTSPYHRGSSVDGLPPSPPSQTTAMSPQHPLSSSGSFSGQVASDGDIASQSQDDICSTQSQEDRNFSEEERLEAELLCRKQASFEIPAHLPPRQRELFLRIQQQQRQTTNEIENIQDKNKVEDDDDWYSSDEDGATPTPKLTDILKNLSQQPSQPAVQNPPSQSGATGQPSAVSIMQMINNAMRSSPVTTNSLPLSTSKRDPRLQSHKPPDRAAGQQGSNSQGNPGDPRLQIGKLSNTIEPPSTITVSKSSVQLPYHLFEIKTDQKRTLPLNVDMFDPRFKNDPRIKRQLSQSESGNQKAATQKLIDTEKNLPKSVDPRLGKTNASEDATQSAPRPTDPRLNRASQLNIPGDPRLLLKKTEQKEVLPELTKPTVPHLPRTSSDQSVASKKIDPRLQRMQSTPPGMHVLPVRALDPRLMRQQQEASKCPAQPPPPLPLPPPPPPPPPPSRAVDPRVTRQQNSDQTVRPNKSNAPRLARPPTDLDVGTIPKLDPRLARQQDSPVPRQSDPRLLRQINQSENQVKAEVAGQQAETQPPDLKMDYRNDPRFKRKASADIGSSSNLAQPPVKKKFTGQRKGSMEYSSPLGIEMDKPESSGYNSYNRPLNTNRQAANTTKSRTSGSDQSSSGLSNIQDVCSRKNTALATEPGISQLPPGISQQMYQQQPPVNPQPLSPQQQLLVNPQQPKLKDLFKTIDPTASPFC